MKRERIDFATFKEYYINHPNGYFPVYSSFDEDYEGDALRLMDMDMICEWRLDDGKVRFIEVPFDTEEEFKELVGYLHVTASLLNKAIVERIGELDYATTKPESQRIPYPPSDLPTLSDEELESIKQEATKYHMHLLYVALQKQQED